MSPMCNTQEKFQLESDKNERKWVEHGFQNAKIDIQSCLYQLTLDAPNVQHLNSPKKVLHIGDIAQEK